ncbi:MAG: hypothetical protein HC915_13115 [Anaerolineae bacterium]|nr:hypothetical protein [Anaerolineae bacterium]
MDEQQYTELNKLLKATKALSKSVERVVMSGMAEEGTGKMVARGYQSLHKKAAELMPDDYYITEGLLLEMAPDIDNDALLSQVRIAASQLRIYLEETLRESRREFAFATGAGEEEITDWAALDATSATKS